MTGGEDPLNAAADAVFKTAAGAILAVVIGSAVYQIVTDEAFADWLAWMEIQSAATAEMFEFITAIPEIR